MLRPEDEAAIEQATRNAVNGIHLRDPDLSPFLVARCISVDVRKIIASTVYEMQVERLDEIDNFFEELYEETKQKKIDEMKEKETKDKDLQDKDKQGWLLAAKQWLKKHPNAAIQKLMRKFKDEKEEKVNEVNEEKVLQDEKEEKMNKLNRLNKLNQEKVLQDDNKRGDLWV